MARSAVIRGAVSIDRTLGRPFFAAATALRRFCSAALGLGPIFFALPRSCASCFPVLNVAVGGSVTVESLVESSDLSLSLLANALLVGSEGFNGAGAAHIYTYDDNSMEWVVDGGGTLVPAGIVPEGFGRSVSISEAQDGIVAVIGAPDVGMPGSGTAYIFRRNNSVWSQEELPS